MILLNKILLVLLFLTVVVAVGFVIYKTNDLAKQQAELNKSMVAFKQIQDDIARSSSQYVSKQDLENFITQNKLDLDDIKKNLGTLNATITGVNVVSVVSKETNQQNLPSTTSTPVPTNVKEPTVDCNGKQIPCPDQDVFGYMKNQQNLELDEKFGNITVPFGQASFSAWQKNPWTLDTYQRTYNITNVLGTDQDGRHYIYNKFSINTKGKDYAVDISSAKFEEEYPAPAFSFWNPRLELTTGPSIDISQLGGSANFGIALQIMSYGKTKISPDISILQIGAAYQTGTKRMSVLVSPISFNIGGIIPGHLVDNTYIGPSIQVDVGGNIFTGINLSIGF
jgi:hypothetical protein